MARSWDVFCVVVDNFGDVGVTWRLARQLAGEHGQRVRLWIDDLAAFARLCPEADPRARRQWREGVEIRRWDEPWRAVEPADVVIEAFACQLPAAYLEAMARRESAPLWLNLEYLSAEDWVGGCHALPSPQANGLAKFFFFPGFVPGTGGLLREGPLLDERRAFQADPAARRAFLGGLGIPWNPDERLISLFAYEQPALGDWLRPLVEDVRPTRLLVPEGRVLASLGAWLGDPGLRAGDCRVRGRLSVQVLPFVRQDDFDRLLWCCDLNAVRGEDSFVRAQWAGRPLLWHIYPQEQQAHLDKLEAFLERYCAGLAPDLAAGLRGVWLAWNQGGAPGAAWPALLEGLPALREHAERWCVALARQDDLARQLLAFAAARR
ncbi:MAG TPA: elongation factor P maturation arginine rhamnosyltransferase EarP [Pseudomonas sp.]|nr:elongation factor P maturation arginine rhamnosyltransferase EarP [Pseudomonas sp.]